MHKVFFIITVVFVLLAIMTFPIYEAVYQNFCEKTQFGNCTLSASFAASYYSAMIAGVFILGAIISFIVGLLKLKRKK